MNNTVDDMQKIAEAMRLNAEKLCQRAKDGRLRACNALDLLRRSCERCYGSLVCIVLLAEVKMRYYLASSLENIEAVKRLHKALQAAGHTCTYDWTTHGPAFKPLESSVVNEGAMHVVAAAELKGVRNAEVCIVLLPGGRGTHVELGAALALVKPVIIAGLYNDFDPTTYHSNPNVAVKYPCAFHYAPGVVRIKSATHETLTTDVLENLCTLGEVASVDPLSDAV